MSFLDVDCPTCGAQAGAVCLSADILEGVKEIKGGHKARCKAAFQTRLRDSRPSPFPDQLDFSAYGGVIETVDKTHAVWHMLKRTSSVMPALKPGLVSTLSDILKRVQALDELRAQGAGEEVLNADKEALRTLIEELADSGQFVFSLDQVLIIAGAS